LQLLCWFLLTEEAVNDTFPKPVEEVLASHSRITRINSYL
jgi:hypothetical protein